MTGLSFEKFFLDLHFLKQELAENVVQHILYEV